MTDKKDEALKLALVIVEEYVREHGYGMATLNAIKEALADQPENQVDDINVVDIPAHQCQHAWKNISSKRQTVYQCEICGIYTFEQPAQQQEPVAWMYRDSWGDLKLSQSMPPNVGAFPLYTSPPASRPWVSLTDEERRELRKRNQQHDAFAKAIDAALKEKNCG